MRAHHEVVALQAGDPVNTAMWQAMVDASSSMFAGIYARLSVDPRLTLVGESFYNSRIPAVIAELDAMGLLEDSEGAKIMRVPGHEVPLMVRKVRFCVSVAPRVVCWVQWYPAHGPQDVCVAAHVWCGHARPTRGPPRCANENARRCSPVHRSPHFPSPRSPTAATATTRRTSRRSPTAYAS